MSFRFLSSLNSPPLVAGAGLAIAAGMPFVQAGAVSIGALKILNLLAFATNVAAVSVPGRMDGDQDAQMRSGDLNPNASTPLTGGNGTNIVSASRDRTLVAPAGWAFSIWGPIYLGEAILCASQYFDPTVVASIPEWTVPFVAANLTQSLWCASFRSSYAHGWHKYVSVFMLGSTALSLSQIPFAQLASWYFLPVVMHFGWTTAATLVNLNGSVAMNDNVQETTLIACGHASAILGATLGVGVTLMYQLPAYGFTLAWALAACANGMRVQPNSPTASDSLKAGAKVQTMLLTAGSALSAGAAFYTIVM